MYEYMSIYFFSVCEFKYPKLNCFESNVKNTKWQLSDILKYLVSTYVHVSQNVYNIVIYILDYK
jgi:hypothetical protein